MALTKVGPKYQVTIPKKAREAWGIRVGDIVEATASKDGIVLRPKLVVDKHPEIEKRIREGLEDIKKGRVLGPFNTAKEAMRALRAKAR